MAVSSQTLFALLREKRQFFQEISSKIWENPEENFHEQLAHGVLTEALDKLGFEVTPNFVHETGFKGEMFLKSPPVEDDSPRHICVIAEYDALPGIGHGCGHNLIAACALMVGFLLKTVLGPPPPPLPSVHDDGGRRVKLTVVGTPAEEGGGGKVKFIDEGFFKDVDVAVMAHPSPYNLVHSIKPALHALRMTFRGSAAHAAMAPWKGVNALDAAVTCYSSISHLRQQFKPDWRVHGVFSKGGDKPNIIPAEAELLYYARCQSQGDMQPLLDQLRDCARGAALASGCSVDVSDEMPMYKTLLTNPGLQRACEVRMAEAGLAPEERPIALGSTDFGNVSHEVPGLHPMYRIGDAVNHSAQFTQLAISPFALDQTCRAAVALSLTLLDYLNNPSLVKLP